MVNEGSINATAAVMRGTTPIELGCGRKDKDRKGRLRGKRTRKARSYTLGLPRLPYLSITTFVLALFFISLLLLNLNMFGEYLFSFTFFLSLTFKSTWPM